MIIEFRTWEGCPNLGNATLVSLTSYYYYIYQLIERTLSCSNVKVLENNLAFLREKNVGGRKIPWVMVLASPNSQKAKLGQCRLKVYLAKGASIGSWVVCSEKLQYMPDDINPKSVPIWLHHTVYNRPAPPCPGGPVTSLKGGICREMRGNVLIWNYIYFTGVGWLWHCGGNHR